MASGHTTLQSGDAPSSSRSLYRLDKIDLNNLSASELEELSHMLQARKSESSDQLNGNTLSFSWIIDTGASHHMSGCLSHFTNIRRISPLSVGLPNGDLTIATQSGDIYLSSSLILRDVLYAANLTCNLISVSSLLLDHSLTIQFSHKLCLIQDRSSKTVIGAGEQSEGLYYLKGVRNDEAHVSSVNTADHNELWHRRMDEDLVQQSLRRIALHELRRLTTQVERVPLHSGGEPGHHFIHRMLTGHHNLCKEQLRLNKEIFISLANLLREKQLLVDGRYIKIEEQLGLGLYMLAKPASVRDTAERFQHSISAISSYFKKVVQALEMFSAQIIRPYQSLYETSHEIQNNIKYWPFFKDCIGAIDGTLIQSVIADDVGKPYRDRHGGKTWNVMAVCSLNMLVTHINVGYEGSAHDTNVWRRSLGDATMGFPHPPPGKYYVVDSAYPNTLGYLSPYIGNGLRYHLPDFKRGTPPEGIYEQFNYRHSSCRNVIERVFAVLKNRWKILKSMPQIDEDIQLTIIVACFTLHNFIRLHDLGVPFTHQIEVMEPRADHNMYDDDKKKNLWIMYVRK